MTRLSNAIAASLALLLVSPGCASSSDTPEDHASPRPQQEEDSAARVHQRLSQAEEAWTHRLDTNQLFTAIEAWEEASTLAQTSESLSPEERSDIALRLARAYDFAADATQRGLSERETDAASLARLGAARAQVALSLTPNSPHARFWLMQNLRRAAHAEGVAASLEAAPQIHELLDELIANPPRDLEAQVKLARAWRACGADFGRDLASCETSLDQAATQAPDLLDVALAHALLLDVARNDRAAFEARLNAIANTPTDALSPEATLRVREARELVQKSDRLFGPS
ncbi:hypothetical protein DL240_12690 [Lujinxingia litoralis]|uniref:Uncharacterized protein n=1 Tax=Lujinxingia litoralis TaxID=2211119 RepID=A0A328C537_9DELT|nr:hypothetical protein [Lujinxingia litoralis]RAL21705.1 hypothetical protein DL240_12690 [Lujinxingia litoralis]